jgi:electron transport complex protein RnfG
MLRNLEELIPASMHDNDLLADTLPVPANELLGTRETTTVYRSRRDDRTNAVALTAIAPDGYNGGIRLLVAIQRDGSLAGVRVVSHRETPGLGDGIDIDRSNWISVFDGASLDRPPPRLWKVKKDGGHFDQLTGATITPRAVVKAVRRALEYFAQHREHLLQDADVESGK